jgi:hypothetical protein
VLSEALAFEACAELANEILASRNIPDRYTGPELLAEFVGQNFRGMVRRPQLLEEGHKVHTIISLLEALSDLFNWQN